MKTLLTSLRLLAVMTILTGLAYPLAVWCAARLLFPHQASGSILVTGGKPVGSSLLAQRTQAAHYFHPRPSSADYATLPSGASNQAWTSRALQETLDARAAAYPDSSAPSDLLTSSASGLDPHLSPQAVRAQVERVARARGLNERARTKLDDLIAQHTEGGQFTPARVNVLHLNLTVDRTFSK